MRFKWPLVGLSVFCGYPDSLWMLGLEENWVVWTYLQQKSRSPTYTGVYNFFLQYMEPQAEEFLWMKYKRVGDVFLSTLFHLLPLHFAVSHFRPLEARGGSALVWWLSAPIHHSKQALFKLWQGWNLCNLLPNATSSVHASGRRGHRDGNKDEPSLPH